MKKVRWATHKSMFGTIASSSCLVAGSAGIIFGVSAATFKVEYMNLNNAQARLKAAQEHNYYSQNIISQWNMFQKGKVGEEGFVTGIAQPKSPKVDETWWTTVHHGAIPLNKVDKKINPAIMELEKDGTEIPSGTKISDTAKAERKKYSALVIDGSTHTAMDRSFNQGLYNGLVNFNMNEKVDVKDDKDAQVFKPSQDSTQEFINIYRAVAAKTRILSLAGFNHVTPLNALGKQLDDGTYEYSDENINSTGMMLMDGDVANNQNVASVLFRSDEPAFLTAIATAMYFYNNLDLYHDHYQDLSVATYGGTAIPTVIIYMGGFQRGVEFFNRFILQNAFLEKGAYLYMTKQEESAPAETAYFIKHLLPASKYKNDIETIRDNATRTKKEVDDMVEKLYDEYSIKVIKLGDFGTHFSGTFNSGDAIGISKQYLNRGASAVIAVAGPQSLDTAQEIMNQNSKAIVIGVDSAMERSDYQKPYKDSAFKDKSTAPDGSASAQASNIIKFSAIKDMTNVSDKMLRLAGRGLHWDINNDKPWASPASIPSFTEGEVFPFTNSTDMQYEVDWNDADGTYDVKGFIDSSKLYGRHVIQLPLTATKDGKTYKLHKIYGFNFKDEEGKGGKNLGLVDTLCFTGNYDPEQIITFGNEGVSAFDYSNWRKIEEEDLRPGVKYIDLSNVAAEKITLGKDCNSAFVQMVGGPETSTYQSGIIKFDSTDKDDWKERAYNRLFGATIAATKQWPIVEPHPYKSICSFGFKTCGNIENGLISISWDGWPLLFEALNYIRFPEASQYTNFYEAWLALGEQYCADHETEVSSAFKALFDPTTAKDKFITYDTKSPLYENYSHVMAILGLVLTECKLSFKNDMTVLLDREGKPYLPEQNYVQMSILDWLKTNMYFTL